MVENRRKDGVMVRGKQFIGVLVCVAIAGLLVAGCGSSSAAAATLEPASNPGTDPFASSVAIGPAVAFPGNVRAITNAARQTLPADTKTHTLVANGTAPGLYGGSGSAKVCNPDQLVGYLQQHADKAAAWAAVLGIAPADIQAYVATLTPVVLTNDTLVTNHGFKNGKATSLQSVLQAGTAVMVDANGTPRVKCNCGNPLTPPQPISAPRARKAAWAGYAPQAVTIVQPGTAVTSFTVINILTGDSYVVAAGGDLSGPSSAPAATTTTTIGAAPSTSFAGDWNINLAQPGVVTITLENRRYTITAKTPLRFKGNDCDVAVGAKIGTIEDLDAGGGRFSGEWNIKDSTTCEGDDITGTNAFPQPDGSLRISIARGETTDVTLTRVAGSTPGGSPAADAAAHCVQANFQKPGDIHAVVHGISCDGIYAAVTTQDLATGASTITVYQWDGTTWLPASQPGVDFPQGCGTGATVSTDLQSLYKKACPNG